jgi:hypothetical protein
MSSGACLHLENPVFNGAMMFDFKLVTRPRENARLGFAIADGRALDGVRLAETGHVRDAEAASN